MIALALRTLDHQKLRHSAWRNGGLEFASLTFEQSPTLVHEGANDCFGIAQPGHAAHYRNIAITRGKDEAKSEDDNDEKELQRPCAQSP